MRALVLQNEQTSTRVIFASNLSDSQILQALSNGMRPFDIPNTGRVYSCKYTLGKAKNERFPAANSHCRENLKYDNLTTLLGSLRQTNCTKRRAVRAARLLFLVQPIKSLICGVPIYALVVL